MRYRARTCSNTALLFVGRRSALQPKRSPPLADAGIIMLAPSQSVVSIGIHPGPSPGFARRCEQRTDRRLLADHQRKPLPMYRYVLLVIEVRIPPRPLWARHRRAVRPQDTGLLAGARRRPR